MNYFTIVHQSLYRVPKIYLVLSSLFFLAVLTYFDFITGIDYGFTLFYFFAVLLITWFINLRTGLIFSFLSILSWFTIRLLLMSAKGGSEFPMLLLIGEASLRLLFLSICCYVLYLLKKDMAIRAEQTKELVELNRVKNFFVGMVAHDLRNPLSVVEMSAFYLLEDKNRKNFSDDQILLLESIYRKSVFMLKMIEEYLDIVKIEAGHLQLDKGMYNYELFVRDIAAINTIIALQKNIRIDMVKENDIPLFFFDRNKISQVVTNLLVNAINYSTPDTTVKIIVRRQGSTAVTEIVDNGPGIHAEDMNKLFAEFYRGKTTTERGMGLGLTISKKIVEAHGGTIGFRNNIGRGSTFWFRLPLEESQVRTLDKL